MRKFNNKFEIYETDFKTEEEKMIGIYPLDKVNESDIKDLYEIRLEEEKMRALAKKEKDQEERLIADYKEALKLFDPNYQHLEGEEFKRNSSLKKKIESLKRYLGDKVE